MPRELAFLATRLRWDKRQGLTVRPESFSCIQESYSGTGFVTPSLTFYHHHRHLKRYGTGRLKRPQLVQPVPAGRLTLLKWEAVFLVLLVCLSGCALIKPSGDLEPAELMPMAPPVGPARRVVQQITAFWPGRKESLLCVLELDKQRIAIAGLSSDGISLFNLSYDGKAVTLDKSPLLPAAFSPEFIIKDLQLVYWPLAELQKILPKHWRLEADNQHRRLYYNNDILVDVDYLQPDAVWAKDVAVTNHRYHYHLHIKTLSYDTFGYDTLSE